MFYKKIPALSMIALIFSIYCCNTAFAASSTASPSSSINFTSLTQMCAVVGVHLNGANHTVICRKARTSGKITPFIARDNSCDTTTDQITIYSTQSGNETILCFYGNGYTGVNILHVQEVDDNVLTCTVGATGCVGSAGIWFRWYQPGTYTALVPGHTKAFGTGVTNITITQLCIGNVNFPSC